MVQTFPAFKLPYTPQTVWKTEGFALDRWLPTELPYVWPSVRKILVSDPELWKRGQTVEDFFEAVMNGGLQLWYFTQEGTVKGVLATELRTGYAGNTLAIVLCIGDSGGNLELPFQLFIHAMEQYARRFECTRIVIEGRDGWSYLAQSCGFVREHVLYAKTVYPERVN
jgi:hypothetical protein